MGVVILEGVNGVGKSTYARALEAELGWPMYRPFRRDPDNHWTGIELDNLRQLQIPVNTFVEDACAADALVQLKASAIMDRSMPSALVYAKVEGQPNAPTLDHLLWWQETLRGHAGGVLLVQLEAPLEAIQERIGGRAPTAERCKALTSAYSKVFQRIRLPKMRINTARISVERGIKMIKGAFEVEECHRG